ncbi:hypothetical protein CVT26_012359 [Gymnopilus dilepis]|uniref:Uncharacterized protein n=1 Tax=Gymnopilus dilepis TaxID=231916 RepID=A0A409WDB6_9AGAR|nr:hypothetical protein CVT26_012359 [Gymnopilus dilepis]
MPPRYTRYLANPPTYQPFPEPPELGAVPSPIKEGIYSYSSTGFTVMGYRPKRPSELLAAISEQYEERELDRFGRKVRGGRGSKKGKKFFHAHLTWYGLTYEETDTVQELEENLLQAMSVRPPPVLPPEIYAVEEDMRTQWLGAASAHQDRLTDSLVRDGKTIHTSELLAELTGATTPTDDFFAHPNTFFSKYFPRDAPRDRVILLLAVDKGGEDDVWSFARDMYKFEVVRVERWVDERGRGLGKRERISDFVIGRDAKAVKMKAEEVRQDGVDAAARARYRPY